MLRSAILCELQALSVNLRQHTLDGALRNVGRLKSAIETVKRTDANRLRQEYDRLVQAGTLSLNAKEQIATRGSLTRDRMQGLQAQGAVPGVGGGTGRGGGEDWMANPALPNDILQEAVPGNIRRAEHFVSFLKRFVDYLKRRLSTLAVEEEKPTNFLANLQERVSIDGENLWPCDYVLQG